MSTIARNAQPLQLQVNNSGAWKTVSRWESDDVEAGELVHEAIALLGGVDTSCTWRITTQEKHPVVLKRWTAANGWSTKR